MSDQERIRELEAVLEAIESWEAEVLNCDACWRNDWPTLTESLYDKWIELQTQRNKALRRFQKEPPR